MHIIALLIITVFGGISYILRVIGVWINDSSNEKYNQKEIDWYKKYEDKWLPASKKVTKAFSDYYRVEIKPEQKEWNGRITPAKTELGTLGTYWTIDGAKVGIVNSRRKVLYSRSQLWDDEYNYLIQDIGLEKAKEWNSHVHFWGSSHYYNTDKEDRIKRLKIIALIAAAIVIIWGVYHIVWDIHAMLVTKKYNEAVADFKDTVEEELADYVLKTHQDIIETEISGYIETKYVRDWVEYTACVEVKIYVDNDLSQWDPHRIQTYVNRLNDDIRNCIYDYRRTEFPLYYYMSYEGEKELTEYMLGGKCLFFGWNHSIQIQDDSGDVYEYDYYGYLKNGESIELPRRSSISNVNSSVDNDSNGTSNHYSSPGNHNPLSYDYAWNVDDYNTPDDYADDAWGADFDDWDDAYDYWEENY